MRSFSDSRRDRDEQPQECAPDAQRSRGNGAQCGRRRAEQGRRRRASSTRHAEDRRQMGRRGSARKASRACAIALQGPFHRQAKPRRRHAPRSRRCAASATPASRSPAEVGVSPATVSRILRRLGLNRIRDLEPAEPVRRYERATPGEMIHIDIKKLGRFEQDRPSHHRRSDRPEQRAAASAGSSSTSASTTPRASPSPRSSPTRRPTAPFPSSRRPSPTTKASASRSPAS